MKTGNGEIDLSQLISGKLNLLGLEIDLGKLLSSAQELQGKLEELRKRLQQSGGQAQEWKAKELGLRGHLRTHGILGEREYHLGTHGFPQRPTTPPLQPVEPPVDTFEEEDKMVIVAEVPGIDMADLDLKIASNVLQIATKPQARRSYRKDISLAYLVDERGLQARCLNGILEIKLPKKPGGGTP